MDILKAKNQVNFQTVFRTNWLFIKKI